MSNIPFPPKNAKRVKINLSDLLSDKSLTLRELRINVMILRMLSIQEIAAKLNVSSRTIEFYRKQLLVKLDTIDLPQGRGLVQ
jgi:DNA-binding CsgD family transcriptional regulator